MTDHEAREWLSVYLDEALAPADRRRVEAHLETCAECRRELAGLRQTVALLHRMEPARAPVGFVDRVAAAARSRPWYRRAVDAVFRPLSIKLPVEVTALVMVGLLAAYLFERVPELQQAARQEGPRVEPAVRAAPPGAERPREGAPAAERREPPARLADKAPRPAPPAQAPVEAPPPARALGERDRSDMRSRDVPPARSAVPAPSAAPPREAKMEAPRENVAGGAARPEAESRPRAQERGVESPRAAPSSARLAAKRVLPSADVVTRVAVKDRDAAERELTSLIVRLGGSVTERRRGDEATVVEALVPQPRYAEFSVSLARIGAWQVEAERPDLPAQVRVILRLID